MKFAKIIYWPCLKLEKFSDRFLKKNEDQTFFVQILHVRYQIKGEIPNV